MLNFWPFNRNKKAAALAELQTQSKDQHTDVEDSGPDPDYQPHAEPKNVPVKQSKQGNGRVPINKKPRKSTHGDKAITAEKFGKIKRALASLAKHRFYKNQADVARRFKVHPVTVGLIKKSRNYNEYRQIRNVHSDPKRYK